MAHEPTSRPIPDLPRSTLVYGEGEAALSMLAAGLALKCSPGFGWANCSGSTVGWEGSVLAALEAGSSGRQVERVRPEELEPHPVVPGALHALVDPEGLTRARRERLVDFLRLPDLFQRLVANRPSGVLLSAIILTNADALPYPLLRDTLGDPRLHHELRVEGVSLVVTYRGNPPTAVEEPFDRLLRVGPPTDGSWVDSFVRPERGAPGEEPPLTGSLRVCWQQLGLDARTLPRSAPGS